MPADKKDNASWRGRRGRTPGHRAGAGRVGENKASGGKRFEGGRDDDRRRHRDRQDTRPFRRRDEREERKDSRPDRDRPRKDFDRRVERGDEKPWRRRDDKPERGGGRRPYREGAQEPREDRPKFGRPRFEHREREERQGFAKRPAFGGRSAAYRERSGDTDKRPARKETRPRKGGRPSREGAQEPREDRPKFSRPRFEHGKREERQGFAKRPAFGGRSTHRERSGDTDKRPARNEARPRKGGRPYPEGAQEPREDRPKFGRPRFERREREERQGFAKRPAFGGRSAYRERTGDTDRRPALEAARPKKAGERIAKVLARAGLASRRDAEGWIVQGRVSVNGRVINSPALDVTADDAIAVDGKPLPPRERTRLFLYHKPRGLMTTHADPEGRPTVFDNLPDGLPRLISVGRLDFNTEGLLLLTNDGGLARVLELPETGWLRRYRVRAHGGVSQDRLDELKNGVEVDGVKYGPIDATLEREQGSNVWLVFAIREGKNREVRNVLSHLGLDVNRLIRISYGPFQLADLAEGEAAEVKSRVLREQLGDRIVAQAGADFTRSAQAGDNSERAAARAKEPYKPSGKSALIADRKGRRVLVQRTGGAEALALDKADADRYGPPRRPKRGYHGKRDLKPRQG